MSRALPSVASSDLIKASFSLNILGADSLTTYQFSAQDIINISALSFEVPFGGGLGKPSNYTVTLGSSLDWIKTNRRNLVGADVRLSVHVNSDVFQPHRGRVRGIDLDGADVNQVKLSIYDRFLDANPLLPVEAIVDSWSTPHLEHLNDGYPLFYGNVSSRFIYFTAVTSNAGLMLGPRNVASNQHTAPQDNFFFSPQGIDSNFNAPIATLTGWDQQSGSDNLLVISSNGLLVTDVISNAALSKIRPRIYYTAQVTGFDTTSAILGSVQGFGSFIDMVLPGDLSNQISAFTVQYDFSQDIDLVKTFMFRAGLNRTGVTLTVTANSVSAVYSIGDTPPIYIDVATLSIGPGDQLLAKLTWQTSKGTSSLINWGFQLFPKPQTYARNHFYSNALNNSFATCISTNPLAILDHISSFQSGIPYRQDQSSAAQVLVQSWQFNGYVGPERVRMGTLLDDFASTVGFYAWAGDSGMVQYRVYQESGAATVDRSVGPNDFLEAPTFKTNPLGITLYNSQLANKFSLDWNFTFHTGQYGNTTVAGAPNVSFCVSATAAGIQKEIRDQSKWIIDPDTASYAVGHMVRINGQGQEYVDMRLPARFFTIEPADVLQVQHPSIVGSAALYQVVRTEPDYLNGNVRITASKLLDLTNPAV